MTEEDTQYYGASHQIFATTFGWMLLTPQSTEFFLREEFFFPVGRIMSSIQALEKGVQSRVL